MALVVIDASRKWQITYSTLKNTRKEKYPISLKL